LVRGFWDQIADQEALRYCASEEEFPMTFQVALVAKNGWLMASDTLENRYAGAQYQAVRETINTKKITYH
jgi:hypothetical protein